MAGPTDFDCANITLSYPLYACDFDYSDPNRLVVGGGGGATKSGVGNKIVSLAFDGAGVGVERLSTVLTVGLPRRLSSTHRRRMN
jgi:hypothetical protein